MAFFWKQITLLLWKNFLLQKRKLCVSVFEVVIPVLFVLPFILLRSAFIPVHHPNPQEYRQEPIGTGSFGNFSDKKNFFVTSDLPTCVIGYVPDHPSLRPVMSKLVWTYFPVKGDTDFEKCSPKGQVTAFKTVDELEEFNKVRQKNESGSEKIMNMAVVFEGDFNSRYSLPKHIHMNFRVDKDLSFSIQPDWLSTKTIPDYYQPPTARNPWFSTIDYRPLITLQALVGTAVLEEWAGRNLSLKLTQQRMPYPPYVVDMLALTMKYVLPISCVLTFLLPVAQFTKSIVYEKQRKLKESMKLMGLIPSAHWAAWFITCMIFMTVIMGLYSVLMSIAIMGTVPVMAGADPFLFFVFMLLYSLAIVTFCFMISAIVWKDNIATVVAIVAYSATFGPFLIFTPKYNTMTYRKKMFTGLAFNSAFGLGINVFCVYLEQGATLNWNQINEPASPGDTFALSDAMILLLFDSAIHLLVTWYLDNVMPGAFGVPKPYHFPFQMGYWFGSSPELAVTGAEETVNPYFEPEPHGMKAGIAVKQLTKKFGSDKVAVNNLSLNMLENQITVLLGHNGAGKSTTMFMLTGFLPPTSGTALINGLDIRKDMDTIRRGLGLCPQHDILFDTLTVWEHLTFFANLKGCPASRVEMEVDQMLKELGLQMKRDAHASTLSGGQKRKLSVGIALIGGSKVVILDEPTSSMDPASRRQTWELLQRHRAGRTILLSTHFMDEADVLGDRIAIMAAGQIQCCGSPMFLKKLYGTGYQLTIVKTRVCQVHLVTDLIQEHVPAARLKSEVNTELCYVLPDDQSALFPELFRQLQARSTELGIVEFGTSATTMEEVFLKVGEISETEKKEIKVIVQKGSKHCKTVEATNDTVEISVDAVDDGKSSPRDTDKNENVINSDFGNQNILCTGYQLTIVKTRVCQVHLVTDLIQEHVPAARLKSEVNTELCYVLPDDQSALFPELFRQLQARSTELGIVEFGTSATTMEEVFLKVGEISETEKKEIKVIVQKGSKHCNTVEATIDTVEISVDAVDNGRSSPRDTDKSENVINSDFGNQNILSFNRGFDKLTGAPLQLTRFRTMMTKKMLHTWRNRLITLMQLVLPALFTCFALSINFTKIDKLFDDNERVNFDLSPFGKTYVPYFTSSIQTRKNAEAARVAAQAYATQAGFTSHTVENGSTETGRHRPNVTSYLLGRAKDLETYNYNKKMVIGATFYSTRHEDYYCALFNTIPYHAFPISVNYLLQGLVRQHAGSDYSLSSSMKRFHHTDDAIVDMFAFLKGYLQVFTGILVNMLTLFGLAFLVSPFMYQVVKERFVGAKHLQTISGMGPVVFWGANMAWDYFCYLMGSLVVLGVFGWFQSPAFTAGGNLGVVTLILFLYGWAVLPFMYLFSVFFSTPATAMVIAIVFNALGGGMMVIVVDIVTFKWNDSKQIVETVSLLFKMMFPQYSFTTMFTKMIPYHERLTQCKADNYTTKCFELQGPCCDGIGKGCGQDNCTEFTDNYLDFHRPGFGSNLLILFLQGLAFMALTLLFEFNLPQRLLYLLPTKCHGDIEEPEPEDSDVAEEKRRIGGSGITDLCTTDALLLTSLYKQYGKFVAVKHVSVGVPEHECFGLLGQNGAGKSTIFSMLTGLIRPSNGNAYIKGSDIKKNIKKVQSNLGYCPQFDALHDQLTGRETLTMYSRLRGVPSDRIDNVVDSLSEAVQMSEHVDKLISSYSGGTKRKLSTAISLVGDPAFILLDEPSAGMDPGARRQLWDVLSGVRASGRTLVLTSHRHGPRQLWNVLSGVRASDKTLVLTSHSMDECEALCTRIAIMVNGSMVCLGSPQHLKNKFGLGYSLLGKMIPGEGGVNVGSEETFISFVAQHFPSVVVFDQHEGFVHLQLPDPRVQLADVFSLMEHAKEIALLQDYSVHMTTLEQVFLRFTHKQVVPKDPVVRKLCPCCC